VDFVGLPVLPKRRKGDAMIETVLDSSRGGLANSAKVPSGQRNGQVATVLALVREAAVVRRVQRALLTAALHHGTAEAADAAAVVDFPPGAEARVIGLAVAELLALSLVEERLPGESWGLTDWEGARRWLDRRPPLGELRTAAELVEGDIATRMQLSASRDGFGF
jgi:hypothetical protein